VVVLLVVGINGGLDVVTGRLTSSIKSSWVSSSSTTSALKLGLVKNKSEARIFGDSVVVDSARVGTGGWGLNVVVGTNWSSNTDSFSSDCSRFFRIF
jgi:hypothetical protein